MILLIDQGNSFLKWSFVDEDSQQDELNIETALNTSQTGQLPDLIESLPSDHSTLSSIYLASVKADEQQAMFTEALYSITNLQAQIAKSSQHYQKLLNGYKFPEQMGIDRWLAMIALWHQHKKGFIVVDAGSALTLDVVDNRGVHLGGHIIPGLSMQKKMLKQETDRVSFNTNTEYLAQKLGKSTSEAVNYGCIASLSSYVSSMYVQYSSGSEYPLYLTGGDASTLSQQLEIESYPVPNLVLAGLYLYFNH